MELLILFSMLQAADALSTIRFLKHGISEGNPLMKFLFEQIGVVPALVAMKLLVIFIAYSTLGAPYWNEVMIALCVIYIAVVIRNFNSVKEKVK